MLPQPLQVAIVVPTDGPRQWQVDAINRAERAGVIRLDAVLELSSVPNAIRDAAVGLLARLEGLINSDWVTPGPHRQSRSLRKRCSARQEWPTVGVVAAHQRLAAVPAAPAWPLVINLSGQQDESLRSLGSVGVVEFTLGKSHDVDDALNACRLGHSTIDMVVSLDNTCGSFEVGRCVAAVRERTMVVESLELLLARAAIVLARGIAVASTWPFSQPVSLPSAAMAAPLSLRDAAGLLKWAVGEYARTARCRLQSGMPIWFLAYRESPADFIATTLTCSAKGLTVITPPAGHFHADPCVFRHHGVDHVFFEDYQYALRKGVISWMQRLGTGKFSAPEPVLERPYHLSYPFVFAYRGDVFMVPESSGVRRVELYRAIEFPSRWEQVGVLLDDVAAVDATLLEDGGRWWMFAAVAEAESSSSDELFVYHSDSPLGRWQSHTANPVKSDARSARPAGRLFRHEGRLIRPAQNCSHVYGGSLALCEVLTLTPTEYRERVVADLGPRWTPGNSRFHTLSFSEGLEVIDGNFPAGVSAQGGA